MEKYLWRFFWDCRRSGSLDGLIVATEEEIKDLAGKRAYFGEVLGKHSEVYGNLNIEDFEKVDIDSESVTKVSKVLGDNWSGFDPREYLEEDEDDSDDN